MAILSDDLSVLTGSRVTPLRFGPPPVAVVITQADIVERCNWWAGRVTGLCSDIGDEEHRQYRIERWVEERLAAWRKVPKP